MLLVSTLALLALTVAAYANSFDVPFLLDDGPEIVREAAIRPPFTWAKLRDAMRPVVRASYALNYRLGELDVFGYHLFNLIAHLLCGGLVFGFARTALRSPAFGTRYESAADPLALVAAGIFLLHPIQTESVAYVSQRAEVLGSILLLASLWIAALRLAGADSPLLLPTLVVAAVVGIFTKEQIAVLPALAALYDWCFVSQGRLRPMLRRWPFYALLAAIGAAATAQALVAHAPEPTTGFHLPTITPWRYLTWQFGVSLYYLRLAIFPDSLCFHCGYDAPWPLLHSRLGDRPLIAALLLLLIGFAAWRARPRLPLVPFAVFATALILSPSSIVPQRDTYLEHRLYLPIAFLALALATAAFDAGELARRRLAIAAPALRAAGVVSAVLLLALCAHLTARRNEIYRDPLRLWQDSVAKAPENHRAQYDLANRYNRAGDYEKAIEHYRKAAELYDRDSKIFVNLGSACMSAGRHAEAAAAFERAVRLEPGLALAHRNLAYAYREMGRLDDAIAAARRALAVAPSDPRGRQLLASLQQQAGERPAPGQR